MSAEPIVQIKDINKFYGDNHVVRDLNLDVLEGQPRRRGNLLELQPHPKQVSRRSSRVSCRSSGSAPLRNPFPTPLTPHRSLSRSPLCPQYSKRPSPRGEPLCRSLD